MHKQRLIWRHNQLSSCWWSIYNNLNPDKNIYISPWFRVPAVPGPGGGAPAEPGGEGGDPGDQQPHRGHPPPPLAAPGYVQTPSYNMGGYFSFKIKQFWG